MMIETEKWREAPLTDSVCAATQDVEVPADAEDGSSRDRYFDLDRLASDEVSGSMTGTEVVGACRESAVAVLRDLVKHGNNGLLVEGLVAETRPLLSDEGVLLSI
mmetsp:Transcript_12124/g.27668  ORF Transcript_12124/g.27668 Transcript_12124/m.27668 type:complete len:105 (+) Transcript_12124:244-558(+)